MVMLFDITSTLFWYIYIFSLTPYFRKEYFLSVHYKTTYEINLLSPPPFFLFRAFLSSFLFRAISCWWGAERRSGEASGVEAFLRAIGWTPFVSSSLRASLPAQYFHQLHWFRVVRRSRTLINARGYRKLNVQVSTAKSLLRSTFNRRIDKIASSIVRICRNYRCTSGRSRSRVPLPGFVSVWQQHEAADSHVNSVIRWIFFPFFFLGMERRKERCDLRRN